jgi:hypothetical protein
VSFFKKAFFLFIYLFFPIFFLRGRSTKIMTWLQISCPLIQEVKSQVGGIWAAGQERGKIVGCVGQNKVVVGACVHCSFTHVNLCNDAR